MILGYREDKKLYMRLPKALQQALDFLNNVDLKSITLGRHEISGEDIFANVMAFESVDAKEKQAEVHQKYIDLQCLISGEEKIEFGLSNGYKISKSYDIDNDFYLVADISHKSEVLLSANMFAVFFPGEAHKPGCSIDGNRYLKKIVVKINKNLLG